jgi:hypothetical protein
VKKRPLPALTRLLDLDDIAAAIVFHDDGSLVGSATPDYYTEPMLAQIVMRLRQIKDFASKARVTTQEGRFYFESFGIWLRRFSGDLNLAIFFLPSARLEFLRQPINLAIVNLEKAIQGLPEEEESTASLQEASELAIAAQRAELELLKLEGEDSTRVLERLGIIAGFYFGPVGQEVIENSLREVGATLPLNDRAKLLEALEHCGSLLPSMDKRQRFLEDAGDLLDRIEIADPEKE